MAVASYFETVAPTYIEQWPQELRRLSVKQVGLELTEDQVRRLGKSQIELFATWGDERELIQEGRPDLHDIRQWLTYAIYLMPSLGVQPGAFVRLGSRSAKDSFSFENGGRCEDGDDALKMLLDTSERINDDLHLALSHNYRPWLWVRQWHDIAPWQELRCFMHNRELVGISQYQYSDHSCEPDGYYNLLAMNASFFKATVEDFFPRFRDACHLDTCVFDVFVRPSYEVTLLEVNPFFALTDPCLFADAGQWPGDFDGSFRYMGKDGKVKKI